DTPSHRLFARPIRALSHGCIRIEEPVRLAQYLLRDDREWDATRIRGALSSQKEQPVKLGTRIPVHIGYFTAWADAQGRVHFRPDVYGYDGLHSSRERLSPAERMN